MLVWDEIDVLTVLEVIPEIEDEGICYVYTVKKHDIELIVKIFQFEGDISFEMFTMGIEKPIFRMQLYDCAGILRKIDKTGEYLDFAPSNCFFSNYIGESSIPYGVRIYVNPSISLSLFD